MKVLSMKNILLSLLVLCATSQAAALTINSTLDVARVNSINDPNLAFDLSQDASLPNSRYLDATAGNGDYARTQIDYSGDASAEQVTFSNTIALNRVGASGGSSQVSNTYFYFAVTTAAHYDLSGFLNVTDSEDGDSGRVSLSASLRLVSSDPESYIAYSRQSSTSTHDESFVLKDSGGDGDSFNENYGNLAGYLIPNRTYEFTFNLSISAGQSADGGASALGNVILEIGGDDPATAVPDSGTTSLLLGAGLFGVATLRRRFKRS